MNVVPIHSEDEPEITTWDAFWLIYPKRSAKKDARKAWDRIAPSLHNQILSALVHWRRIWIKRGEMDYVPHPATWLNGERWEDELPSGTQSPANASHVAAVLPASGERGEMPESVRALIAKLRGKA